MPKLRCKFFFPIIHGAVFDFVCYVATPSELYYVKLCLLAVN